jgi:uncharacterized membrane protein YsdA (DUF1294 family)
MKILFITLLLLYNGVVNSEVFKCIGANGSISYSDSKCEKGGVEIINIKKPNAQLKQSENYTLPFRNNANSGFETVIKDTHYYFYTIVFSVYLLMSVICYFAYRRDKKYARNQQWRMQESTLHFYELFGGWPGGLIAQRTLRHKNRKLSYQISFWFIVTIHIVGWVDYLLLNQSLLHSIIIF